MLYHSRALRGRADCNAARCITSYANELSRALRGRADCNSRCSLLAGRDTGVAPFAGARIATVGGVGAQSLDAASRPSRARGLQLLVGMREYRTPEVAPFAGARIATVRLRSFASPATTSRPSRARGLQQSIKLELMKRIESRALRGRADCNPHLPHMFLGDPFGRALRGRADCNRSSSSRRARSASVAPFAGARIATCVGCRGVCGVVRVAPFAGARIATSSCGVGLCTQR